MAASRRLSTMQSPRITTQTGAQPAPPAPPAFGLHLKATDFPTRAEFVPSAAAASADVAALLATVVMAMALDNSTAAMAASTSATLRQPSPAAAASDPTSTGAVSLLLASLLPLPAAGCRLAAG